MAVNDLTFVLQPCPPPHALYVGRAHHLKRKNEIETDEDIPTHEQAAYYAPAGG
jgi:hypothetical protein